MTISIKRAKHTNVRTTNIILRVIFTHFLIITISPLTACTSLISNASPTDPVATAVEPADGPTPTFDPSAIVTSTPFITSGFPLIFIAEADARVTQSSPDTNYGNSTTLHVDEVSGNDIESFIRFTVTGVSGTVQSARLRLSATANGTTNGPAVYSTDTSWTETKITWNTRPARTSNAVDNKDNISTYTWVEYDVTSLVTGNGIFSFVLVADSNDAVNFSSRQGLHPPELVITPSGSVTPTTPNLTSTAPANDVIFVGAGDISSCENDNDELTAQLLDTIPGTVFTTGDNAYMSGTYTEYINCYEPTWGRHKARTKPVPGNHEYRTSGAAGYFQYFDNIPSYYYVYNLGSWRIYALNSEIDVSANSPQITWLQADLAANPRQCVLAYWHSPRWSSGSTHGNSLAMQTLWQILYEAGAELVITGHEHNYERFAEMNAFGTPLSPGLRQIVIGTGGGSHYEFGTILPSSQVRNFSTFGVLKLTLHTAGYDWQFVPVAGSTFTDSGSTSCH